ncbi:MAG: CRISPR-associated helicase Cas3' [Paludibacter sp.]|nr:CRISPR-associated helicase Cas3' [Paludibacter sp.]
MYNKQFFEELIPKSDLYFAHLPKQEQSDKRPELLSEHSALVMQYATTIAETHKLNIVIKKLIHDSIPIKLSNHKVLAETIEQLFWQAIAFHDLGKLNLGFQKNRMKNYSAEMLKVIHSFENQHSIISVYLFLALFFRDFIEKDFTDEEQLFVCNVALYLSYPIFKHHSPIINKAQDETNWDNVDLFKLSPYLSLFKYILSEEQIKQFHSCFLANANFNFFFDHFNNTIFKLENAFPLYALIKLNYSLLTASDYLATAHYMNDWKNLLSDFGVMDASFKTKLIYNAQHLKSYNCDVYKAFENGETANPDCYLKQSNTNLNALRKCIAIEVVDNVRKNVDKSLFYIETPTGGGKTNVSMLALAELLRGNETIQKAFYVFPFTTLITQTYQSLSDTLGLDVGEIAEIHSKAALSKKTEENSDYINYLDNLFMNYPIVLLSHIYFFDVLKTNHKETNYLLHRMANSVVIIDEIQSYSPKIWDKIIYFIVNYAKYFNMKFIIMSATLPKIGDIIDRKELVNEFVYLIADKNKYFQNPNFCNRVQFDYSLLEWAKPTNKEEIPEYLNQLSVSVFEKSKIYSETSTKYPDSVLTIVEFIFKKTASDFYSLIKNQNDFFDEIYLLSGTILEPRRKQIISKLKSEETRKQKVLLITTQVVEAGVDIDMDLGFKDKSIIDSEEQLAGRINRNVNKQKCKLYLFDCNSEKTLYGDDDRYKLIIEMGNEYRKILENKDFDKLYQMIIEKIKKKNNSKFIENLDELFAAMATLDFRLVNNSLNIINQQNISIFVPLDINIDLIEDRINTLSELNIPFSETLSGKDVWNKYAEMIKYQDEDFIKNKIIMKKLQSLLTLFTFSIFPNSKDLNEFETGGYGKTEYGFFYLSGYNINNLYSFDYGINADAFKNSNFL